MYGGFVNKRNSPISPPSMQRTYCVLWGTLLLDFENEEEAKTSMSPRCAAEILGVSDWDGHGRANVYPNGFLLVTHTGGTYYFSVSSRHERDEWIVHVKRALECNFANPDVVAFKPSKLIQRLPPLSSSRYCMKTKAALAVGAVVHCKSCGHAFSSSEFVNEYSTMLQVGVEEADRCCLNCKLTQAAVIWLRTLNYVHVMTIHEFSPVVNNDVTRYKATFKLRRRLSHNLDMAAALLEQGDIRLEEYEELRQVDHDYRWEKAFEESTKLKEALDVIGHDMHMIVGLLINSHTTGRMAYTQVIVRLLEIADQEPELIDFYLPQLLKAHLTEACNRSVAALIKLDLLQQALLVLGQRYPPLALKMAWLLISTIQDYSEKRVNQVQYAASVVLLLQLEMSVSGIISSVADVPTSHVLATIIIAAAHQQHELASDVSTLFLVRRKLQEDYDAETVRRSKRHLLLSGTGVKASTLTSVAAAPQSKSCLELLQQLGVGQASSRRQRVDSNDTDDETGNKEAREANDEPDNDSVYNLLFSVQLDFVDRMCQIAEALRFIPRENRKEHLNKEITQWNAEGESAFGWDPTCVAGEPVYKIVRILADDCRVFRTKARAPTMIVCEVRRQDVDDNPISKEIRERTISDSASDDLDMAPRDADLSDSSFSRQNFPRRRSMSSADAYHMERMDHMYGEIDGLVDSSISKAIADMHTQAIKEPLPPSPSTTDRKSQIDRAISDGAQTSRRSQSSAVPSGTPSSIMRKDVNHHMHDTNPQSFTVLKATIDKVNASDIDINAPRTRSAPNGGEFLSHIGHAADHGVQQIENMFKKIIVKSPSTPSLSNLADSAAHSESKHSSEKCGRSQPSSLFLGNNNDSKQSLSATASNMAKQAFQSVSAVGNSLANAAEPATGFAAHTSSRFVDGASRLISKRPSSAMLSSSRKSTNNGFLLLTSGFDSISSALSATPKASIKGTDSPAVESRRNSSDSASEAVRVLASAKRLLDSGSISQAEYNLLVSSDGRYRGESAKIDSEIITSRVGGAYGESWVDKKRRVLGEKFDESGENGFWPAWDLRCFIIKSNDDLRQEVCCLQLMELMREIFEDFGLANQLWLKPYRIVSTGNSTGLVQVLTDSMSLDALKKTNGFTDLCSYFLATYSSSPDRLLQARKNFMSSLAAYSLFTYILFVKDRHNGNILIGRDGHIMHIDFGFILSIAPGGSFSLESAPFKLTEEMVEVIGGLESPMFNEFVKAFTAGFLALRANAEPIIASLQVLSINSPFPCFVGKDPAAIIEKMRQRFRLDLSVKDVVQHCLDLVIASYGNYGTKQYDNFQRLTNGIW